MEWTALAVALIAALTAVAGYSIQRSVDRKNALILKRRDAYLNYLKCVLGTSESFDRPETLYNLNLARMELTLLASDNVLRSLDKFDSFSKATSGRSRDDQEVRQMKELLSSLIAAMRKDCFDKTALRDEDIYKIIPFSD